MASCASKVIRTDPPTGMSNPLVAQFEPLFVRVGVSAPPLALATTRFVIFSRPAGRVSLKTTSKAVVVPSLLTSTRKLTISPASRLVVDEVIAFTVARCGSPTVADSASDKVVLPEFPGVSNSSETLLSRV